MHLAPLRLLLMTLVHQLVDASIDCYVCGYGRQEECTTSAVCGYGNYGCYKTTYYGPMKHKADRDHSDRYHRLPPTTDDSDDDDELPPIDVHIKKGCNVFPADNLAMHTGCTQTSHEGKLTASVVHCLCSTPLCNRANRTTSMQTRWHYAVLLLFVIMSIMHRLPRFIR